MQRFLPSAPDLSARATFSNSRLGLWVVLLLGIFAWAPATFPGYWLAEEGFTPVFNTLRTTPLADIAVAPDLWRGSGGSVFVLAQSLLRLGLGPVAALRLTFIVSLLLGSLGVYAWLVNRLGDRAAALASLTFAFFPPLLATVYVRGNPADLLVAALLPMALASAASYRHSRAPSGAGVCVLSILWMWRAQAGLAALASLILLAYALWVERDFWTSLVVSVSGLAGLSSLLPLWRITAPPVTNFQDGLLNPAQLLGAVQADPSPFALGFPALGCGIILLWALWVRRQSRAVAWITPQGHGRLAGFALLCSAILIGLTLPISAPLWSLTGAGRLLSQPGQLLLLAAPWLALSAGSLVALIPALTRTSIWAGLCVWVVLAAMPHLDPAFTQVTPPERPLAIFGQNNFVLLNAELTVAQDAATLDVEWQSLHRLAFDYNLFFQALAPGPEGLQVIGQLDAQPKAGLRPTTSWQPGEILTDTYRLELPLTPPLKSSAESEIVYYFGYYDWRDGQRLAVDGGREDKVLFRGP